LAIAEAFCLEAASHVTPTAASELKTAPGHRATLVVERFDRRVVDGRIVRIHQEDGCQVLGLPPGKKYHEPGVRPTQGIPQHLPLARVLAERAAQPPAELGRFLEQVTVNVAFGNLDAHLKNYSIQHVRGAVTLSPLYDVSPTRVFIDTERYAALAVGGKQLFEQVTRSALVAEARLWGMPEARARDTIDGVFDKIPAGLEHAKRRFPAVPAKVVGEVERCYKRLRESK
jgi:serine/threonine-protein kinase HipA